MSDKVSTHDLCGPRTFNCSCNLPGHMLHFWYDEGDKHNSPTLTVTVCMEPNKNIFRRIWTALRYIFGTRNGLWEYSDTLLDKEGLLDLRVYINDCYENANPVFSRKVAK